MVRILIIFLLFCINFSVRSQYEPQISMHYSGQLSVNPAFAGSSGNINLAAVSRQQWVGFDGAPNTTVAGVDGAIKVFDRFHGFGLVILNDEIGAFNTLMININYAYRSNHTSTYWLCIHNKLLIIIRYQTFIWFFC